MKKRADGRWLKVITIEGKKHYFYSKAATEKQAERDIKRQLLEYTDKQERGESFDTYAQNWLSNHGENIEYYSIRSYKTVLSRAIAFFGSRPIKDIASSDIEQYIRGEIAKGLGYAAINQRMTVLRQIFKAALVDKIVDNDPTAYITLPKNLNRGRRRTLTPEEIEIVKKSIDLGDECFFAAFLLLTGCRLGEALAISWDDIDLAAKTLSIHKTVEWRNSDTRIKDHTKTTAGVRVVPLPQLLVDRLAQRQQRERLLFCTSTGAPLSPGDANKRWKKFEEVTKIIGTTPHMYRHAYATLLYDADIDVKTAQYLLGHSTINVTLNIYTHLSQARKDSAADKINAYLA